MKKTTRWVSFAALFTMGMVAGIFMTLPCIAGVVQNVTARQVQPWDGLVEIGYELTKDLPTVSGATVEQTVTIRDVEHGTNVVAKTFTRPLTYEKGAHRIVWNARADGCSLVSTNVIVTISLRQNAASLPLYMVIDLSGGTSASSYPVSYLHDVPSGGWTDEYKTTKLVLRRIEPGTFTMGSPSGEVGRYSNEDQHQVTLTKPFYMGVFQVTQRQWELVMGTRPSFFSNASYYTTRPVEQVSWNTIRGTSSTYNWPNVRTVDAASFMGKVRAKTGLDGFDLPTEAQWEYACRAGTTTALNSGKNLTSTESDSAMNKVGRYYYNGGQNESSSCTTSAGTAKVGSYAPNAWGLYDMHGNVCEWCLDWYWYGSYGSSAVTDPVGATSGTYRVLRGGGWSCYARHCRSATPLYSYPPHGYYGNGFRLCCSAGSSEKGEELGSSDSSAISLDLRKRTSSSVVRGERMSIDYDAAYLSKGETALVALNGTVIAEGARGTAVQTVNDRGTLTLKAFEGGVDTGLCLTYRIESKEVIGGVTYDTAIGTVTGATNVMWRTGGAAVWTTEELEDGCSVRSGAIGKNSETWVECVVTNGCRVSYDWKVSCESGEAEEMYDFLSLNVDGDQVDAICGESGWTSGTVLVAGEGEHVLRWTYQKDYRTSEGEDCGWLGRVKVDPEVPIAFDANGATSGDVPAMATAYFGDTIVIPGTGTLARSGHTFGGWACGSMVYGEGASFNVTTSDVTFTAVWNVKQLGRVTLAEPETSHVTTEKIAIRFNLPEHATAIRYTVDGREPTLDSPIYTGTFEIESKAVTVKAIAYADDWLESACATWELTRAPWSAPECLNIETRTFSYAGTADWVRDLETTHDGKAAMRSGTIADKEKSTIQMPVTGSGTVSFWCKVSSECDPDDGAVYDGLAVQVDGVDAIGGLIGGEIAWTNRTILVNGEGEHVVTWSYVKDRTGKSGDDCAWLDEVLWQADQTIVTAAETGTRDVVIGREWIEHDLVNRYGAGRTAQFRDLFGTDYDLAVRKPNGKTLNGKAARVWQDYVAGTDPTDTNSVFTASIEIADGAPVVKWSPDLKSERSYSIWGCEKLSDAKGWACPTNSAHHFFRVTVEMP